MADAVYNMRMPSALPWRTKMRIGALDCFRGVILLTILINHYTLFVQQLGHQGPILKTLTQFGYSSAAEQFFLISGYLVGLLYIPADKRIDTQIVVARLIGRSAYLYVMNCFLFVAVIGLSWFFPEYVRRGLGLAVVDESPFFVAFHVVRLGFNIPLLGILNFYVIMMLAAVPIFLILKRSTSWAILLIIAIYGISQVAPWMSLAGGRYEGENGLLSFNPLAWQVLFMGGMVAGRFRFHELIQDHIARTRRGFLLVSMAFLAITLIHYVDMLFAGFNVPFASKQNLRPVRLLHALITFIFLFSLIYRFDRFSATWPYRSLSLIGSYSLQCFMASVILSYAMAAIWFEYGSDLSYFVIVIFGCIALLLFSLLLLYHHKAKRNLLFSRI
jgi:hypothetical protein